MDVHAELRQIKRLWNNGAIGRNEYRERTKSTLFEWSEEPKEIITQVNPAPRDLYQVLELRRDATETEIRSSYKKLALRHHPDRTGGAERREWRDIQDAYEILSDTNKRLAYDERGVTNSTTKTSLNSYVGGDAWEPYIGDLEAGRWLFSIANNENSPAISSSAQRKKRHAVRISNLVRNLQNKLSSRFDNASLEQSLQEEALRLSAEPNGKELLSLLGEIYAQPRSTEKKTTRSRLFASIRSTAHLFYVLLVIKFKGGPERMNQDEITQAMWRLAQPEITSIARETRDKFLSSRPGYENTDLANSLQLLGIVWSVVGQQFSPASESSNNI